MTVKQTDGTRLTKEALARIEARLLTLQGEYLQRAGKITVDVTQKLPADSEERATALENADVLDALGREAVEEAGQVSAALVRLHAGRYGLCIACGNEIAPARLEAYPAAARCISCEEAQEARN